MEEAVATDTWRDAHTEWGVMADGYLQTFHGMWVRNIFSGMVWVFVQRGGQKIKNPWLTSRGRLVPFEFFHYRSGLDLLLEIDCGLLVSVSIIDYWDLKYACVLKAGPSARLMQGSGML
jgi:hypothetical protein